MISGSIQMIIGPMFAGKTTLLIEKLKNYERQNKKCVAINYYLDNRYSQDQKICSHDNKMFKAIKVKNLESQYQKMNDYDVIGIDQAHFFVDIVQFANTLAALGKKVIVCGLDGTFQQQKFNKILDVVPIADYVTKLLAKCYNCPNKAAFTQKILESNQIQVIGGSQIYRPACRRCIKHILSGKNQKKIQNNLITIQQRLEIISQSKQIFKKNS